MVDHRHQAFFSTLLTQLPSSLINFPFRVDIHLSWTGEREAQGVAYKNKKKKGEPTRRILSRTCTLRHWRTPGRRNEKGGDRFLRGRDDHDPLPLEMFHAHETKCCRGLSTRFPVGWKGGGAVTSREALFPDPRTDRPIENRTERRVLSKSEVIENFWESGKDWDLDHTSGPHDCTSLTAWYFRRRDVIERRKLEIEDGPLLLGCFRWLSLDRNASSLTIPRSLFTMHSCADRMDRCARRSDRSSREKEATMVGRIFNDLSTIWWIGDIIAMYAWIVSREYCNDNKKYDFLLNNDE